MNSNFLSLPSFLRLGSTVSERPLSITKKELNTFWKKKKTSLFSHQESFGPTLRSTKSQRDRVCLFALVWLPLSLYIAVIPMSTERDARFSIGARGTLDEANSKRLGAVKLPPAPSSPSFPSSASGTPQDNNKDPDSLQTSALDLSPSQQSDDDDIFKGQTKSASESW